MTLPPTTDLSGPETGASARIVRWLCHDMASPIATLLTASELLGEAGDAEINELITAAIRRLSARLRLVRMALGSSSTMTVPALQKLLAEALPDTPLTLDLTAASPPASIVASAALILTDINRVADLTITDSSAFWPSKKPLPDTVVDALTSKSTEDPRSAMVTLAAAQANAAGWQLKPAAAGITFAPL